jgi:hypothetical protein
LYIPEVPRDERSPGREYKDKVPPPLEEDVFGQDFLQGIRTLVGRPLLETTASWMVKITSYVQEAKSRLILHMVNYNRDESAPREIPIPERNIGVSVRLPEDRSASTIHLLSPDRDEEELLIFTQDGAYVQFTVPEVLVYDLVVVDME